MTADQTLYESRSDWLDRKVRDLEYGDYTEFYEAVTYSIAHGYTETEARNINKEKLFN